jgi:hypothetical protein
VGRILKRLVLWDFPRAGWQYDLMVGSILAFIFFTPRDWFRDQPRASSIVQVSVPAEHGVAVYWIEPDLITAQTDAERMQQAGALLDSRTGKKGKLVRLEPMFDAEQEVKAYMAVTKP